ncbi:fungal-specific transcription factor domain-containing protein [Xylaria intraflava]|nr:fungal-specific transcription factor domain-containing protein [Xylaria intraflava]
MLSNPLQRFSPYHSIPSNTILSTHVSGSHIPARSLETIGHGPQYTRQHLQHHVDIQAPHLTRTPQQKHRQHPYGGPGTRPTGSSGPIRRRISRACDQCNQLRTKCDGQHPCAHCIEFGLGCEYIRERKKRGKASRKDLAQQAAAQAAATEGQSGQKSPEANDSSGSNTEGRADDTISPQQEQQTASSDKPVTEIDEDAMDRSRRTGSLESLTEFSSHQADLVNHSLALDRKHVESSAPLDFNGYGNIHNQFDRQTMNQLMGSPAQGAYGSGQGSLSNYPELPYSLQAQSPSGFSTDPSTTFRMATTPIGTYPLPGDTESPGWINTSPPPTQYQTHIPQSTYHQQLRYPVLNPLIPHLGNIIPLSLACDLIDLYFSSSSSAHAHPMSPYVLGFIFRKRSFLHPSKPRHCQPALLASMLWAAAQTSDAPFLTQVPSARGKICQKLLELTVNLLKPLIHTSSSDMQPLARPGIDDVSIHGLVVNLPNPVNMENMSGGDPGAFGAAGSLDDVVTYIHLATVVSASEYKGASMRWWNAAWSLARELKLGRELPPNTPSTTRNEAERSADTMNKIDGESGNTISEEEREERRRIWWLVYIMDRHLALCYNRPLSLLDIECESLLQPMDDTEWQNGNFGSYATDPALGDNLTAESERARGPQFKCTGHSIFGYFLPLMTILGEIVDLHHARNHPRFGVGFRPAREWDDQQAEIVRHLETYEESLNNFEQRHFNASSEDKNEQSATLEMPELDHLDSSSVRSAHTSTSRMTESDIQTRIVVSYGTHVMHVLHILLTSKWDPINLLDDNDLWISSQSFITATGHAVSAAEAISNILEYDPGLEFMPFFYGIYLLQGSFLLLLIADKLQGEASPSVVRACETIIRAHEACVVTLNTEYQRNFSRVMRSALAQVRGRVPEDLGEQHQRRRELLALYRWTGGGSGLAL